MEDTRIIMFTLDVDFFCKVLPQARYISPPRLIAIILPNIVDWSGKNYYCGLNVECNYKKGYIDISMPYYVPNYFFHPTPKLPQYTPYQCTKPAYSQKIQYYPHPILDKKEQDKYSPSTAHFCTTPDLLTLTYSLI